MLLNNLSHNQAKKTLFTLVRWEIAVSAIVLMGVGLIGLSLAISSQYYSSRLLPNTMISGISVGNLSKGDAVEILETVSPIPDNYTVTLMVDDISISSDSASILIDNPYPDLVQQLLLTNQEGTFISQGLRVIKHLFRPQNHDVELMFEPIKAKQLIVELSNRVNIQGESPSAELVNVNSQASLKINPGKPGRSIDQDKTLKLLNESLSNGEFVTTAAVASHSAPLTESQQQAAKVRAQKFIGKSIKVVVNDNQTTTLFDKDLVSLLHFPDGYSNNELSKTIGMWENQYNRPSNSAEFTYDPITLRVDSFTPPRNGLELQREVTANKLRDLLIDIEQSEHTNPTEPNILTIEFVESNPETTLAETNNLGITERIGVGHSKYDGSILTRVHNVGITSDRITNQIVRPGEEFSFNNALGEVSARTGFKPAYVIRAGKTELGDGGGVCQVSSTLFRALLDSGLDITRRLQHSYRVGYYELNSDPGFDATVYSGNVDLRFKNDTENHVLIHVENDSKARSMRVELYGTSDGRRTEILDYEKWGAVGAPAPEYILDPTLQPGQRVQIDWAVGGLKTKFTHKVYKSNGELLRENTYYSNYRPWSAKYRVGALPN